MRSWRGEGERGPRAGISAWAGGIMPLTYLLFAKRALDSPTTVLPSAVETNENEEDWDYAGTLKRVRPATLPYDVELFALMLMVTVRMSPAFQLLGLSLATLQLVVAFVFRNVPESIDDPPRVTL